MFADRPAQTVLGSMSQSMAAMLHHVSSKRLGEIRASRLPILVITGTNDSMVSPSGSYHLQKELDAHMVVFEGCGHGLGIEKAEVYYRLLEELVQHGHDGRFEV